MYENKKIIEKCVKTGRINSMPITNRYRVFKNSFEETYTYKIGIRLCIRLSSNSMVEWLPVKQ